VNAINLRKLVREVAMRPLNRPFYRLIILSAAIGLLSACGGTPTPSPCSTAFLITEINNANASPATTDTINLAPGCIYELAVIDNTIDGITSPIIINGNGATIRRSPASGKMAIRLFHVSATGDLTLTDVTLFDGIAIEPTDVTILVRNSGGAIYNAGQVAIHKCTITDNHAMIKGGGIYNTSTGSLFIDSSTIQHNGANIANVPGEIGGGIYNEGDAEIINSTIAGNKASQSAAGIGNNGDMRIFNSTISGNSTTLAGIVNGPAIVNGGSGSVEISYTTITGNVGSSSPGGQAVFSVLDSITFENSIVAMNTGGDCSYPATVSTSGANLDSDGSCHGFSVTADPKLDPLANNGGATQTHALQPISPAIDAALGSCPTTDQRSTTRPQGSACDLGAYEYSGIVPTPEPTVIPSSVMGYVFIDANGNGIRDASEFSSGVTGAHLTLMDGICPGMTLISAMSSNSPDGLYGFGMLMPGTYCILTDPLQQTLVPVSHEITVGNNENLVDVNFYLPNPAPQQPPTTTPICSRDLGSEACQEAGGTMSSNPATAPICICP